VGALPPARAEPSRGTQAGAGSEPASA